MVYLINIFFLNHRAWLQVLRPPPRHELRPGQGAPTMCARTGVGGLWLSRRHSCLKTPRVSRLTWKSGFLGVGGLESPTVSPLASPPTQAATPDIAVAPSRHTAAPIRELTTRSSLAVSWTEGNIFGQLGARRTLAPLGLGWRLPSHSPLPPPRQKLLLESQWRDPHQAASPARVQGRPPWTPPRRTKKPFPFPRRVS